MLKRFIIFFVFLISPVFGQEGESSHLQLQQVVQSLEKSYPGLKKYHQVLLLGILSEQHVLAFGGPGGAKTQMAKEFLNHLPGPVFSLQFSPATKQEQLIGSVKGKKYLEEGKVERVMDQSLNNHPYGILDEIDKANPEVLSTALSILLERKVMVGDEEIPGKLQSALMTSNMTLTEFREKFLAGNDGPTAQALLDRILFKILVFNRLTSPKELFKLQQCLEQKTMEPCNQILDLEPLKAELRKVSVPPHIQKLGLVLWMEMSQQLQERGCQQFSTRGAMNIVPLLPFAKYVAEKQRVMDILPEDLRHLRPLFITEGPENLNSYRSLYSHDERTLQMISDLELERKAFQQTLERILLAYNEELEQEQLAPEALLLKRKKALQVSLQGEDRARVIAIEKILSERRPQTAEVEIESTKKEKALEDVIKQMDPIENYTKIKKYLDLPVNSHLMLANFSADEKWLVTANEMNQVDFWDLDKGEVRAQLTPKLGAGDILNSIQISPNQKNFLFSTEEGVIEVRDFTTLKLKFKQRVSNTDGISDVRYSGNSKILVIKMASGKLFVLNAETGLLISKLPEKATLWTVSPDGTKLAFENERKEIVVHDLLLNSSTVLEVPIKSNRNIFTLAFSPQGERLLVNFPKEKILTLFKTQNNQLEKILAVPMNGADSATFSPDGQSVAAITSKGVVSIWDIATNQIQQVLDTREYAVGNIFFNSLQYHPSGNFLLTEGEGVPSLLWDIHSGKKLYEFAERDDYILSKMFSPQGKYLLTLTGDSYPKILKFTK